MLEQFTEIVNDVGRGTLINFFTKTLVITHNINELVRQVIFHALIVLHNN